MSSISRWMSWIMTSDASVGERAPLLSGKAKRSRQRSSLAEVDVIERLEGLPILLVRATAIFTMAMVTSTVLGAVRAAVGIVIPKVVCTVPTILAEVWLVHELLVAVKVLRRAMITEERRRRQTLRRIARRRRETRRRETEASRPVLLTSESSNFSVGAGEHPRLTVTRAVTAAVAAATASAAEVTAGGAQETPPHDSPEKKVESPGAKVEEKIENESKPVALPAAREGHEEAPGVPSPADIAEALETLDEVDAAEAGAAIPSRTVSPVDKDPPPALPSPTHQEILASFADHEGVVALSVRAVRVSFLLQMWVRLWLSMAAFTATSGLLLILLFIRLLGVSPRALPSVVIASPAILALALMLVHSILMLDGTGGTGGGAALRSGGRRSALALGRRPVIVLAIISSVLLCFKVDAEELRRHLQALGPVQRWADMISWPLALSPLWMAAAMVEGVYLRAMWENRTGRNCISSVCGLRKLGSGPLCGCLRLTRTRQEGGVALRPAGTRPMWRAGSRRQRSSYDEGPVRWRASLTPPQRAAAAAIAGGILFIVVAMVACSVRDRYHNASSWLIPMTMVSAALGEALIGAGIWRLVREYANLIQDGVPPRTKPLPVLYSEREGGWVVGPADPPIITIFLLGDVALREEGPVVSVPLRNNTFGVEDGEQWNAEL